MAATTAGSVNIKRLTPISPDKYYEAVAGKPQDISDLAAEANEMVKSHKSGRTFEIKYRATASKMEANKVYLRDNARRWEFIEEFSHWRMKYGDRFLAAEKKAIKVDVKKRRLPREGSTAEEIAIKSYILKNSEAFGLEAVDIEYLNHQISSLWKYGAVFY